MVTAATGWWTNDIGSLKLRRVVLHCCAFIDSLQLATLL